VKSSNPPSTFARRKPRQQSALRQARRKAALSFNLKLQVLEVGRRRAGSRVPEGSDPRQSGDYLPQYLQSFRTEFRGKDGETGGIPAGARETGDNPGTKDVIADCDNGDRLRRLSMVWLVSSWSLRSNWSPTRPVPSGER